MSQVIAESDFEYVEQLPDGGFVIRYGIVPVGYSSSGERLLTFGSSWFPSRPTVLQVLKSITRYAEAFKDDEAVMLSLSTLDMGNYFGDSFTFGRKVKC